MNEQDAISIHCGNIREFSRRRRISEAQRSGSVSELLDLIVKSTAKKRSSEVCRELKEVLPDSTREDRAELCMILGSSPFGVEMREKVFSSEDVAAGSHGKIALVRNKFNELAFSCFSRIIKRPKESFVSSFTAACEEVYDGVSEFCILPIENSQNGRLFGFYSMLDRYELRICAVCEAESGDGLEGNVKYALVGRALPDRIPKDSKWYLELSVVSDSGAVLSEIAQVSRVFGAELIKIDSLPVEYYEGLQKYYFTFGLAESNIPAFDLYLTEEYDSYTAVGIYPTVE